MAFWGERLKTWALPTRSILLGLAGNMRGLILTNLPFAVDMWAQMGQITNTPWKNTCWHVASTTSTVESLPVARLGWLLSQAKLLLHVGWHRTRKICQWPWNVKSTIGKANLPQHKPGSAWEDWSLPTTSQLHLLCTTWSLLRTILDPASWWLSQSCDS